MHMSRLELKIELRGNTLDLVSRSVQSCNTIEYEKDKGYFGIAANMTETLIACRDCSFNPAPEAQYVLSFLIRPIMEKDSFAVIATNKKFKVDYGWEVNINRLQITFNIHGNGLSETVGKSIRSLHQLPPDRFTHVVISRHGDSAINDKIYFNGVETEVEVLSNEDLGQTQNGTPCVGAYCKSQYYYQGFLNDFRIYSGALTPAEIKNIFSEYVGFF